MKRLLVAALAASTLMGTVAMADSHARDRTRDERVWNDRRDNRDHRHRDDRKDHRHDRHYDHRHEGRYKVVRYAPPHGYRPHAWYRGARLPAAYYAPRYVVYDYGTYRLRPPPRGYHWVRVDNDVVLAAITTGVVMQVINGIFY
ncbi:MAG TPA: RcnB family protein [Povalibacter sp.]|uniref:RcnB family protein n=1 Tax=Povalibacter sp. TaxID=1962978 RepID=UPI002BBCA3E4|nr:RcnB family protein [Povalibacter sp.]HMN45590.1 RcnB family protein [Povalibacter sp.]